jgi:chromosome segregation ATPase
MGKTQSPSTRPEKRTSSPPHSRSLPQSPERVDSGPLLREPRSDRDLHLEHAAHQSWRPLSPPHNATLEEQLVRVRAQLTYERREREFEDETVRELRSALATQRRACQVAVRERERAWDSLTRAEADADDYRRRFNSATRRARDSEEAAAAAVRRAEAAEGSLGAAEARAVDADSRAQASENQARVDRTAMTAARATAAELRIRMAAVESGVAAEQAQAVAAEARITDAEARAVDAESRAAAAEARATEADAASAAAQSRAAASAHRASTAEARAMVAEAALADLQREMNQPFIVPALVDVMRLLVMDDAPLLVDK